MGMVVTRHIGHYHLFDRNKLKESKVAPFLPGTPLLLSQENKLFSCSSPEFYSLGGVNFETSVSWPFSHLSPTAAPITNALTLHVITPFEKCASLSLWPRSPLSRRAHPRVTFCHSPLLPLGIDAHGFKCTCNPKAVCIIFGVVGVQGLWQNARMWQVDMRTGLDR